ncbi:MAG: hypothetical protein AAF417_18770 [Pseudomonadota bacterium]
MTEHPEYWLDYYGGFSDLLESAVRHGLRATAEKSGDRFVRAYAFEHPDCVDTAREISPGSAFSAMLFSEARAGGTFVCPPSVYTHGLLHTIWTRYVAADDDADRPAVSADSKWATAASILGTGDLEKRLKSDKAALAGHKIGHGGRIEPEQALAESLRHTFIDERDRRDPRGYARARTWRRLRALLRELFATTPTYLSERDWLRLHETITARYPTDKNLPRTQAGAQRYLDDFTCVSRVATDEEIARLEKDVDERSGPTADDIAAVIAEVLGDFVDGSPQIAAAAALLRKFKLDLEEFGVPPELAMTAAAARKHFDLSTEEFRSVQEDVSAQFQSALRPILE